MDQLISVFGLDWKLLVAQVVNFAVLLGVLSYFLYGPVLRVLKERADKIAAGVKAAEAAQAEREKVAGQKAGIIKEAEHQAEMVVARAEEEGKSERAEILKAAQARVEALLKDAHAEAAEAKRAALKESQEEIARTAILAAEKILKNS